MPRPVVPIRRLPRNRSVTLSSVVLYDAMTWADDEPTTREQSTPRAVRASISSNSTPRSTTTPLPITGTQPGVRMPEGNRCSAYFSPSITMVCPALLPPLNLTTAPTRLPSRSVALPLPSSPHWAPTRTIAGTVPPPEGRREPTYADGHARAHPVLVPVGHGRRPHA